MIQGAVGVRQREIGPVAAREDVKRGTSQSKVAKSWKLELEEEEAAR